MKMENNDKKPSNPEQDGIEEKKEWIIPFGHQIIFTQLPRYFRSSDNYAAFSMEKRRIGNFYKKVPSTILVPTVDQPQFDLNLMQILDGQNLMYWGKRLFPAIGVYVNFDDREIYLELETDYKKGNIFVNEFNFSNGNFYAVSKVSKNKLEKAKKLECVVRKEELSKEIPIVMAKLIFVKNKIKSGGSKYKKNLELKILSLYAGYNINKNDVSERMEKELLLI